MRYSVDSTEKKSNKKDWILPILLLINIMIFSALFITDINKKMSFGNREKIGTVTFKINTIRRKFNSSMVWGSLETNSPIANKDSIRTYEESDAIIKLNDGTEIAVDENSLLHINTKDGIPSIHFNSGSINLKTSSNTSIYMGDQIIKPTESADFKIIQKDGLFQIYVDKGTVNAKSSKEEKLIHADSMASLQSDHSILVKTTYIKPNFPENSARVFQTNQKANIRFDWKVNKHFDSIFLEVSRNRDFLNSQKIDVSGQYSHNVSVRPGIYYWRLKGVNLNESYISEDRKLIVLGKTGIDLFLPANHSQFLYKNNKPSIHFSWSHNSIGTEYILEVSNTSNFNTTVIKKSLNTNSYKTYLPPGEHFWRVKVLSGSKNIPAFYSSIQDFSIRAVKELPIPRLLNPRNFQTIVLNQSTGKKILFNWRHLSEIKDYQLDISSDESFQSILLSARTANPHYITEKITKKGQYYWRVRGFYSGEPTVYSKPYTFTISDSLDIEPVLKEVAIKEDIIEKQEIIKTPKKEKPVSLVKNITETKIVKPLFPINHEFDISNGKPLKFNWSSSEKADFYIFKIKNKNTKRLKEVFRTKLRSTSYTFKELSKLDVGLFEWEVTPYIGNLAGKPSSNTFKIMMIDSYQLKPSDIQIISPKTIYKD